MYELKNKVAVITGGASGIGLAYAKELLRRELKGVALVDVNEESGAKAVKEILAEFQRDNCVIFIRADVTDGKQLEDAFRTTVKTYNQFDILLNNAGILNEILWEKCLNINLTAVINGSKLALEKYLPKYRSCTESIIINTASIAGISSSEICPVYSATKSAVIGYTRAMGGKTRYENSKTRMIAICPGLVYTPLMTNITKSMFEESYFAAMLRVSQEYPGEKPEEMVKKVMDVVPNACTGSVWTVTPEGCNQLEFPGYVLPIDPQ